MTLHDIGTLGGLVFAAIMASLLFWVATAEVAHWARRLHRRRLIIRRLRALR